MSKLYSAKEVLRTLQRAGFRVISQRGSHIKLRGVRGGKIQTVIVPNFKEIPKGTFSSILNQADMTRKEFESYLK